MFFFLFFKKRKKMIPSMWWSNILHVILLRADITIQRLIAPRIKCLFHVIVNDKIRNTWKKMSPVLPWTHMFSICRWPSVHSHTFVVLLQVELGVTTEHCMSSSHVSFSRRSMAGMKEIKNDIHEYLTNFWRKKTKRVDIKMFRNL